MEKGERGVRAKKTQGKNTKIYKNNNDNYTNNTIIFS